MRRKQGLGMKLWGKSLAFWGVFRSSSLSAAPPPPPSPTDILALNVGASPGAACILAHCNHEPTNIWKPAG